MNSEIINFLKKLPNIESYGVETDESVLGDAINEECNRTYDFVEQMKAFHQVGSKGNMLTSKEIRSAIVAGCERSRKQLNDIKNKTVEEVLYTNKDKEDLQDYVTLHGKLL